MRTDRCYGLSKLFSGSTPWCWGRFSVLVKDAFLAVSLCTLCWALFFLPSVTSYAILENSLTRLNFTEDTANFTLSMTSTSSSSIRLSFFSLSEINPTSTDNQMVVQKVAFPADPSAYLFTSRTQQKGDVTVQLLQLQFSLPVTSTTTNETTSAAVVLSHWLMGETSVGSSSSWSTEFGRRSLQVAAQEAKFEVQLSGWPFESQTNMLALEVGFASALEEQPFTSRSFVANETAQGEQILTLQRDDDIQFVARLLDFVMVDDITSKFISTNFEETTNRLTFYFPYFSADDGEVLLYDPTFKVAFAEDDEEEDKEIDWEKNVLPAVLVPIAVVLFLAAIGCIFWAKRWHRQRQTEKRPYDVDYIRSLHGDTEE
ncbi:hypothetical protein QOT17_010591 [Balamuthia mandrillaris]